MRYLIDFSYLGAKFNGYQKQPNLRTVQEEIEKVLKMIEQEDVKICSSGRTDAKVNALHQMAHFDLKKEISAYKLKGALNGYLPDDIYINDVKIVDNNFHARYMVKSKTYTYYINTGIYNPIFKDSIYQYCKSLNYDKMVCSIKDFIGTHDFSTFCSSEDKRENKVRTIFDAYVIKEGDIIKIVFKGSGFLKYQVRNMVGLLIEIASGKLPKDSIPSLIKEKDRTKIGVIAPAQGLTLSEVLYK